jgi:hypothetical protein
VASVTFDTVNQSPTISGWQEGSGFSLNLNGTSFDQASYEATIPLSSSDMFVGANASGSGTVFPFDDPYGFKDLIVRMNLTSSTDTSLFNATLPGIAFSGNSSSDLTWGAQETTGERAAGTFTVVAVPEPSSIVMIGLGVALICGRRRTRN